jgi:hypothetical protein
MNEKEVRRFGECQFHSRLTDLRFSGAASASLDGAVLGIHSDARTSQLPNADFAGFSKQTAKLSFVPEIT